MKKKMNNPKLTLDVGCGLVPHGDVNCDLYPKNIGHRGKQKDHIKAENFVQCDAQYLPFKNDAFSKVYSSHVIEHVDNPFLMVKEMLRVTNRKIIIVCPHRLGDKWVQIIHVNPFHKHFLNKAWFYELLKNLGCRNIKCTYSEFRNFPHDYFSFCHVPLEITTEIIK